MTRVVIDTNVFVSGLINPSGNPAKVINMVLNGELLMLYDVRILDEYKRVLRRDKFGFADYLLKPFFEFIESAGESIISNAEKMKFTDEDDKKFYEVAKSGKADFLITGNKVHFPKEGIIVNASEFLIKR